MHATSGECKWVLHSSSPWKNTIYSRIGASVGGVEERESAINYFNNPRGWLVLLTETNVFGLTARKNCLIALIDLSSFLSFPLVSLKVTNWWLWLNKQCVYALHETYLYLNKILPTLFNILYNLITRATKKLIKFLILCTSCMCISLFLLFFSSS